MDTSTGKRTARVRRTLTKRTVDALQPAEKPWIAWDDKLTGFGVRIQPSGTKAFIVNYRAGDGGRKAPNKRVVLELYGPLTADHGWSAANRAMSLLRSIYRRPCVDHDGLRNPVDLWLAGGGKFHRKAWRKISAQSEVLPCWRAGIEAEVNNLAIRDALWFGLYTCQATPTFTK